MLDEIVAWRQRRAMAAQSARAGLQRVLEALLACPCRVGCDQCDLILDTLISVRAELHNIELEEPPQPPPHEEPEEDNEPEAPPEPELGPDHPHKEEEGREEDVTESTDPPTRGG